MIHMTGHLLRGTLLCVMALAATPPGVNCQNGIAAEEYAVFSALLEERYPSGSTGLLVIWDQTVLYRPQHASDDDPEGHARVESPLPQEMVDELVALNRQRYRLGNGFTTGKKYVFVSEEELNEIFKVGAKGWETFYMKFPESSGSISFSRAAFNRPRDRALVYTSIACGEWCGRGSYVLLSREGPAWRVEKEVTMWELKKAN
jgi:hypothetical protein